MGRSLCPLKKTVCKAVLEALGRRLEEGKTKMETLAAERAGSDKLREQLFSILFGWFVQGVALAGLRSNAEEISAATVAGAKQ